jgi:hypothetical protein
MWGVFEYDESIHIIPCDEDGKKFSPHVGHQLCQCQPEVIAWGEDGRIIFNHNQVN